MSLQRDYLMIQIEQVGKVLGKILADLLGIKSFEETDQYDIVKEQLYTELDLNMDELIFRNNEEFMKIMSEKLVNNMMLYEKFSDILSKAGDYYNLNTEKRKQYYSKSLLLLQEIVSISQTYSVDLHNKILNIEVKLKDNISNI